MKKQGAHEKSRGMTRAPDPQVCGIGAKALWWHYLFDVRKGSNSFEEVMGEIISGKMGKAADSQLCFSALLTPTDS